MKIIYIGLAFLLFGCASFTTRDGLFTKRYSGEVRHEFGDLYYHGTYKNGLIDGEIVFGNKKSCEVTVSFVNGKKHGKQIYEGKDGRKVILSIDSANPIPSIDSSVDADGNRWKSYQEITGNGKHYRKVENRFYKTITVSEMSDTAKDGPEFTLLETGDTLCRDVYANGKAVKQDPKCNRSTEDILSVIRKNVKGIKAIYDKYLKRERFKAKIYLVYSIWPDGAIEHIHVDKLFTHNLEFVEEVVAEMAKCRFRETSSPYDDVVTVPLAFTPN
jgi:hypothetical protein